MTDSVTPPRSGWRGWLLYLATILVTAAATYGVVALLMNINERKQEARQHYLTIVELNEDVIDPAEWGKNFPRQYDGYKRTAENTSRRHGGSEAISKLDEDPRLKRIFAGYPSTWTTASAAATPSCSRTRTTPSASSSSNSRGRACTAMRRSSPPTVRRVEAT
jgi:hypothetical protein